MAPTTPMVKAAVMKKYPATRAEAGLLALRSITAWGTPTKMARANEASALSAT